VQIVKATILAAGAAVTTLWVLSRTGFSWAAAQETAAREAAAERAAAEQEASRVTELSRRHTQAVGDVNIEKVASLLDDEDDEDQGLGQIMLSMTHNPRRGSPRRHQQ
jgi:hypothetical protein